MKKIPVIIRLILELGLCVLIFFEAGIYTSMFALFVTIKIELETVLNKKKEDILLELIKIVKDMNNHKKIK